MRIKRLVLASALCATIGTACVATSQVSAAPKAPAISASSASVIAQASTANGRDAKPVSAEQIDAWKKSNGDPSVLKYWSAARMKAARSADIKGDAAKVKSAVTRLTPRQIASKPVAAPLDVRKDIPASPVPMSPMTGRLFFHNPSDNGDYWCSASALNSTSKRLVITAGHCVYGAPGNTWHTSVVFIPSYYMGMAPFGMFSAYRLRTYTDWMTYQTSANGRGFNSDVAMITTYSGTTGKRVADAVGAYGLEWGGSTTFNAAIYGYPGNLNQAQIMWACTGTTTGRWVGSYLQNTITGCNFSHGSSGGPWLDRYNNATGLGYVHSVTSNGPSVGAAYINGPYFDSRIYGMYQNADKDW